MDYVRYLRSKETVDDRALNLNVLQEFESHVRVQSANNGPGPLRVVEVGGGVGAMLMRLLRRGRIFDKELKIDYTVIDIKEEVLFAAMETISRETCGVAHGGAQKDFPAMFQSDMSPQGSNADISTERGIHHARSEKCSKKSIDAVNIRDDFRVNFECADALEFLKGQKGTFDVIIAAAVLDLWELQSSLEVLLSSIRSDSAVKAFYFPINFDGTTDFFPCSTEGAEYDFELERFFHIAMGERKTMGNDMLACHTGRRLIATLKNMDIDIRSMGGATWIVSPDRRVYPADECYFLNCILDFIQATGRSAGDRVPRADTIAFERYVRCRREQIQMGELIYIAHNIDAFGVV